MPTIPETYAAPHLRLGLLLFDTPGTDVVYSCRRGVEIGIPEHAGGDGPFCVAEIIFPDGRPPVIGYKISPPKCNADEWNILCTKALGRALKRAGYPDDTKDLKALVFWRQREAEIEAINAGTANLQLTAAPISALDAAGTTQDAVSHDDGDAPTTDIDAPATADDGIVDAEIIEDDTIADEEQIMFLRRALGQLDPPKSKEVTSWARKQGIRVTQPDLTHGQIDKVMGFIEQLMGVAADGHGSDNAETIAAVVAGLDNSEMITFRKFCKDNRIDPVVAANAPGTLSEDDQQALLGWLDPTGE